jgi:hypothetical protein
MELLATGSRSPRSSVCLRSQPSLARPQHRWFLLRRQTGLRRLTLKAQLRLPQVRLRLIRVQTPARLMQAKPLPSRAPVPGSLAWPPRRVLPLGPPARQPQSLSLRGPHLLCLQTRRISLSGLSHRSVPNPQPAPSRARDSISSTPFPSTPPSPNLPWSPKDSSAFPSRSRRRLARSITCGSVTTPRWSTPSPSRQVRLAKRQALRRGFRVNCRDSVANLSLRRPPISLGPYLLRTHNWQQRAMSSQSNVGT